MKKSKWLWYYCHSAIMTAFGCLVVSGFTIIDKDTLYSVSRSIIAGLAHEKGMGFPKEDEG